MKGLGLIVGIITISIVITTLVVWGAGNLIIYVFDINYTWTIWHGFTGWVIACAFNLITK